MLRFRRTVEARYSASHIAMMETTTRQAPNAISGEKGSAWLRGGHLVAWQFESEQPADAETRTKFGPPPADSGKGGASDPRAISFVGPSLR